MQYTIRGGSDEAELSPYQKSRKRAEIAECLPIAFPSRPLPSQAHERKLVVCVCLCLPPSVRVLHRRRCCRDEEDAQQQREEVKQPQQPPSWWMAASIRSPSSSSSCGRCVGWCARQNLGRAAERGRECERRDVSRQALMHTLSKSRKHRASTAHRLGRVGVVDATPFWRVEDDELGVDAALGVVGLEHFPHLRRPVCISRAIAELSGLGSGSGRRVRRCRAGQLVGSIQPAGGCAPPTDLSAPGALSCLSEEPTHFFTLNSTSSFPSEICSGAAEQV